MQNHLRRDVRRAAFTLIELIIVLLVLASLAALVVPTLGYVRDQADSSISSYGAQGVLNNLEVFKASTGTYPERLDSLCDENGAFYSQVYAPSSPGTFGYGDVGPLDPNFAFYLMKHGAGIDTVMVHDSSNVPGASGFDPNAGLTIGQVAGPSGHTGEAAMCYINSDTADMGSKQQRIIRTCFPNQTTDSVVSVPDGHTLVFLGIGGANSAVGATMTQAPTAPEKNNTGADGYDRFIGVFDLSGGGSNGRGQMKLKCVLDSEFNVVATNLKYFKDSGPSDELGS